jgi:predicted RNA-binding Zn-ribbon protein involved in translation (DUF1610 family)
MVSKRKIDLATFMKSLDTVCTECGRVITPPKIVRVSFDRQKCPGCGSVFVLKKSTAR